MFLVQTPATRFPVPPVVLVKSPWITTYDNVYVELNHGRGRFWNDHCQRLDQSKHYARAKNTKLDGGVRTAEIESALVAHADVAEAADVGFPRASEGQGIYAHVTLNNGVELDDGLKRDLVLWVRKEIGLIASLDRIQWAPGQLKTRSDKIVRRTCSRSPPTNTTTSSTTRPLADLSVVLGLNETRRFQQT